MRERDCKSGKTERKSGREGAQRKKTGRKRGRVDGALKDMCREGERERWREGGRSSPDSVYVVHIFVRHLKEMTAC